MQLHDDRYEILERLGDGGMGIVHAALDHRTGRLVALKRLLGDWGPDSYERQSFDREYEILARLDGVPGIPRVHDRGSSSGRPYFTMDLIGGLTFDDWLAARAPGWHEAAETVARAALRLDLVHEAGIVHGDVKPNNLLIDEAGEAWWIDFGISRPVDGKNLPVEEECIVGTLAFLPPERVSFLPRLDQPRSDVYSLGVLLFEAVVGVLPFDGVDEMDLIDRIEFAEIPLAHAVSSRPIPPALSDVIARAMAKRPADRYESPGAFARAILAVLDGERDRGGTEPRRTAA